MSKVLLPVLLVGAALFVAGTILLIAAAWLASGRLPDAPPPADDDPQSPWEASLETGELGGLEEG